jgi:hypothetical protein
VAKRFMWSVINRVATEAKLCSIILTTHSMEETEALCSRIGIMVGGRLRCLGSAQHLKARFGSGFDVEVKLGAQRADGGAAVLAAIVRSGAPGCADAALRREHLPAIAEALGDPGALAEVTEMGSGWPIHAALLGGSVAAADFAAWWAFEATARTLLRHFVGGGGAPAAFPGATLSERQGSLLRLKVPAQGGSLAGMFRTIESAKQTLGVAFDASLGQTSLEAIFNSFAALQDEERGTVRGWA